MNHGTHTEEEILNFINRFTDNGKRKEVIETFTCGCCYWFAHILAERFNGIIMINPTTYHFATLINYEIYDITGKIDSMDNYQDPNGGMEIGEFPWESWQLFDCSEFRYNVYTNSIYF